MLRAHAQQVLLAPLQAQLGVDDAHTIDLNPLGDPRRGSFMAGPGKVRAEPRVAG